MSKVLSFAEESCWDGDRFRAVRREIVFVLTAHGIQRGTLLKKEFVADFGLWYDADDEWLIEVLRKTDPDIQWDYWIYHRKIDHSAIMIHHPDTGKVVGQIYPRGRTKQKLSGEICAGNIVPISKGWECRAARLSREEERAKRRRERDFPEGS